IDIDEASCPLSRDQWLQILHAENVLARRYFFPGVHRMEPYSSRRASAATSLPATDDVLRRVLVLPTGTGVSAGDIEQIGNIFYESAAVASRLRYQLPTTLPLPTAPLAWRIPA